MTERGILLTGHAFADSLTAPEIIRLKRCESVIEEGLKTFVDVGNALAEIRDTRLYRRDYGTFEDYCRERWGFEKSQTYRLMDAAAVVRVLKSSPIGELLPATESQARPLTRLEPDEQIAAWQEAVETAPNGKVTAAHVAEVVERRGGVTPHVSYNSGENEWYTPPQYIAAAHAVMGGIDTDPASSTVANAIVGAATYYTIEDNGLTQEWRGRVWMNPPYAQPQIGQFCDALRYHIEAGRVIEAITLTNNATETAWFSDLLANAAAVCFVRGRIRFIDKEGNPSGAPLQGQAIVYTGGNIDGFRTHFGQFGTVLYT